MSKCFIGFLISDLVEPNISSIGLFYKNVEFYLEGVWLWRISGGYLVGVWLVLWWVLVIEGQYFK